jgi:hypothetical protein
MSELTPVQIIVIGLAAAVIAELFKWLYAWKGIKLSKGIVSLIAMVISVILAFLWLSPLLVIPTDPMEAANYLINQAAAVLGGATLIYNLLVSKILEKYNVTAEDVMQKRLLSRLPQ